MGQDSDRREIGSAAVILPFHERRHLHEHVSATLFAGFNHVALQLLLPRLPWMDDAARGAEWDKSGDAQLRELLQEKLGAIAFGKRSGHLQVNWQLSLGRCHAGYVQLDAFPSAGRDDCRVFMAVSVE